MNKHTKIFLLSIGGAFLAGMLYLFLFSQSRFLNFCDTFFIEEMEQNALTMHYVVSTPENYGIKTETSSLGSYDIHPFKQKIWILKKYFFLKTIFKNQLSNDLRRTYDLLKHTLLIQLEGIKYILLEEPLVPSIGIQSQLPILLAEYSFETETDVIHYLSLLECIPEYFDSLIAFESQKISNGLFMDEASAQELITYCQEFLQNRSRHFLTETFQERLHALNLDTSQTTSYEEAHTTLLETHLFPSYEKLCNFLEENLHTGSNVNGLCYYPEGTDYYNWLLRSEIGINHRFEEIEALLDNALKKDARIIAGLTKEHPDLLSMRQKTTLDISDPKSLTSHLASQTSLDFPEIPEVSFKLCDVPASMEPHLSPAFYLVPPIDHWDKNVIYLNQSCLQKGISFFTTLAHESYPGHLYQNVYESSQNPHPVERLLYFGGYTEGWATYTEQLSYHYAPISDELATLLSTSRSMTLNLYSHLDLYVHAYGWAEEDCADYLKKFGITNTGSVHDMFLLVKQQPGNYLKYYVGYLEICRLKEQAISFLGSNFDQKAFHKFLLDYGPAPFTLLENYFREWIETQEKGFSELENP